MSVRVTVWKTLVFPVMVFVRFSVGIPRDAIVISVVLRHMQIYLAIPIVEQLHCDHWCRCRGFVHRVAAYLSGRGGHIVFHQAHR